MSKHIETRCIHGDAENALRDERRGITEPLLRLPAGLENADDIISDLEKAPED